MALSGIKELNGTNDISQTHAKNDEGIVSDTESVEDDQRPEGNPGWADSIAKVLNTTKPKTKKTLVLSRAKKTKLSGKEKSTLSADFGFEVEGTAEVKEEKPDREELDEKVKQRRNEKLALRVKPSWKDIERERTLRKVATKGVVQLFNAVRMQQKDLQQKLEDAGPLDSRKEAVLNNINKRKFLDVLMSGNRAKSEAVDNPVKNEYKKEEYDSDSDNDNGNANDDGNKKSEWSVLREDYMTNKKIKHWDEEDSDANSQPGSADDSEDNVD